MVLIKYLFQLDLILMDNVLHGAYWATKLKEDRLIIIHVALVRDLLLAKARHWHNHIHMATIKNSSRQRHVESKREQPGPNPRPAALTRQPCSTWTAERAVGLMV